MRVDVSLALAFLVFAGAPSAGAQDAPPSQQPAAQSTPPAWQGLPFTSLSDFESRIPIGMNRRDLTRTLGQPDMTVPGQGSDQVYHYRYQLADGGGLRAVVILRDGAVFIRRLYISSASGDTLRAN